MHPGQITALSAALAATMITLVAYMNLRSVDPSKMFIRSTWHLTVNDEESQETTPQTWYINTADNVIKIVENDEESGSINVQEIHAGGVYEYSTIDPDLDLTVPAETCDDVDLTGYDGDCESYHADIQFSVDAVSGLEIKDQCSEILTDETISFAETLPCDGNAMVGGFLVSFAECTPTAILDKESGNVLATIDSIEDGIDESVTFSKCQDDKDDEDARRKMLSGGMMNKIEKWGTSTDWCGGSTDLLGARCPRMGDREGKDAQACRRHDHGIIGDDSGVGPIPKLECKVDYDLVERSDGWAVRGMFGHTGVARVTGCLNYKNVKNAPWWKKRGWQWVTRYGTRRMRKQHGMHDRTYQPFINKMPGSHIPHVRQRSGARGEWETKGNLGKPWFYAWVPKDKIYKDRFRTCPQDNLAGRSIENDICWHCNSPNDWGP